MTEEKKLMLLHNVEAEQDVIAAVISYEQMWDAISPLLDEELFTALETRKAYGILRQIESEGKQVEMTDFAMRYMSVGGNMSLFVTGKSTGYELTKQRVEMLRQLSMRRKIYSVCVKGMNIVTDPMADDAEISSLVADLTNSAQSHEESIQTFGQALKDLRKDMVERMEGRGEQGLMTGLHIFDSHFGLHQGDLIIFAGRTSQGKSTLATTIARNMGLMGIPSAYYSLEMGAKQLTARIMARDVMMSSSRMLYDKVNDGELSSYDANAAALCNMPIYYDDKNKTSFAKLTTSIRSMVRKHNIKIAFIDYLQILANGSESNREQLIGDMARDLKRLAVDENICIVAISQLSRAKDKPAPTLMEMRGSGQIEEACDTAVLIYRPSVYGIERYKDGSRTEGTAKLTIAKGRSIGLAEEVVAFDSNLTYFHDFTGEEDRQPQQNLWTHHEPLPF